jgi:hypothetical protein
MIIDLFFFFFLHAGGRCRYHVWARVPMLGEDELSVVRDHWERWQIRILVMARLAVWWWRRNARKKKKEKKN